MKYIHSVLVKSKLQIQWKRPSGLLKEKNLVCKEGSQKRLQCLCTIPSRCVLKWCNSHAWNLLVPNNWILAFRWILYIVYKKIAVALQLCAHHNSAWCVANKYKHGHWMIYLAQCPLMQCLGKNVSSLPIIAEHQFCFSGLPNIVDFGGFSKEISMRGGCPQ